MKLGGGGSPIGSEVTSKIIHRGREGKGKWGKERAEEVDRWWVVTGEIDREGITEQLIAAKENKNQDLLFINGMLIFKVICN